MYSKPNEIIYQEFFIEHWAWIMKTILDTLNFNLTATFFSTESNGNVYIKIFSNSFINL